MAAARQRLPAARCPRPARRLGASSPVPRSPPPALSPAVREPGGARPVAMAFLECHKCPGSIQIDLCETQPCAKPLPIYSQQLPPPDIRLPPFPAQAVLARRWGLGTAETCSSPSGCSGALCPVSFCILQCPSGWIVVRQFIQHVAGTLPGLPVEGQSPGRQKTPGHSNDVQLEGPSFIQPVFKYLVYARHGASGYSTEVHEDRFFFLGITTSTVS